MQHVQLNTALSLEDWQRLVRDCDSATTFRDHGFAFQGARSLSITEELKQIFEDFGTQGLKAVFAVRHGIVEGFWLDPLHNYMAIVCSQVSGDPEDCVLTMSISPSRAH